MRAPALVLAAEERAELERMERAPTSQSRQVFRARIILRAADGLDNAAVARSLGVRRSTASKWRARFAASRLMGLADAPRSGRPSKLGPVARCQIVATACSYSAKAQAATSSAPQAMQSGLNEILRRFKGADDDLLRLVAAKDEILKVLPRTPRPEEAPARTGWTTQALTDAIAQAGIAQVHRSTIGRMLQDLDLKPWTHKNWLHSTDPLFKEKATEICELYLHPPPGSTTICVDEDCGIQILERIHPSRPAIPGQPARREYEYKRHGTMGLIAGFEVGTGQVFGRFSETRTAADLLTFMEELATWRPTGDVHIVWDNLNIHAASRWEDFNRKHGGRFHFHYTPIHASWLNQVECFFSIFSRRLLRSGDFSSVSDFLWKGRTFLSRWNEHEAHPFRWTFSGYPLQIGRSTPSRGSTPASDLLSTHNTNQEAHPCPASSATTPTP
jgi:transposase